MFGRGLCCCIITVSCCFTKFTCDLQFLKFLWFVHYSYYYLLLTIFVKYYLFHTVLLIIIIKMIMMAVATMMIMMSRTLVIMITLIATLIFMKFMIIKMIMIMIIIVMTMIIRQWMLKLLYTYTGKVFIVIFKSVPKLFKSYFFLLEGSDRTILRQAFGVNIGKWLWHFTEHCLIFWICQ